MIPLLLFVLFYGTCFSRKFIISGTITDVEHRETLIVANGLITSLKMGVTTNNYGFYSMTIPHSHSLGIVFTYVGFQPQVKKIYLSQNIHLDIEMEPNAFVLNFKSQ